MSHLKVLRKADDILVKVCNVFLLFTMLAMVGLIVWQVVARYVLKISVPYAEELARLAIVWCIFIGGAIGVRKNEHAYVEALVKVFPPFLRFACKLLTYVLMVIFCVILIIYGYKFYNVASTDFTTSLGYCRNIFYLPAIISGAIMLVYSIKNFVCVIKEFAANKDVAA